MGFMDKYVDHYFHIPHFVTFFLLAFAILFVVVLCIRKYADARTRNIKSWRRTHYAGSLEDRFYEIIFSGTSILFFITVYYLIDRFMDGRPRVYWDKYEDFLLLAFLIFACIINNLLDHALVRLRHISEQEIASGRLIGMLYMIIIFAYIKIIYQDNNYDMFITYFLGLMIGRFVYFDASFKDFLGSIKMAVRNIWLMLIALGCTGLLCLYGFKTEYLLKYNGVITNTFLAHLFMCLAIVIISRLPFLKVKHKPQPKKAKSHETTE